MTNSLFIGIIQLVVEIVLSFILQWYIGLYKDKDKDNLLLQKNFFNNKWLNKIVKLTFEVFGQSK